MKPTKLVIAAGTGFLGQVLTGYFTNQFDEIVILTRGERKTVGHIRYVHWDAKTMTGWEHELENADVLINLAGKSVDCRYTQANKNEILRSRTDSTAVLNMAVLCCQHPPKHWLNSSTATIYKSSFLTTNDEPTGEIGDDFSMNVAKEWEKEFFGTKTPKTLKTALRTSIVLGKKGGAFLPLKNLVKFGLGGKQGTGRQFVSWIHERDFARAVDFIIRHQIIGVVNIVAPKPIRNADFMKALRRALHVPTGIPIGKKLLEFGAKIIGTETELVLKSRNVVPKRLMENGFTYQFGTPEKAFENLTR
ncbi:NAD-dependent epimerase/dehydratase [Flavobacterium longum]|uniref:TIGR01777 family oxidoreductase n=1 Tax=Flavobacterium longum TaxID=1299340 RepID=UPI0039E7C8A8